MTHVVFFLACLGIWTFGAGLVSASIVLRPTDALQVAKGLLWLNVLSLDADQLRAWHARTLIAGLGIALILAGVALWFVAF